MKEFKTCKTWVIVMSNPFDKYTVYLLPKMYGTREKAMRDLDKFRCMNKYHNVDLTVKRSVVKV